MPDPHDAGHHGKCDLSLLNKKLYRDMLAHKAQVVAVLIIVLLGTSILTLLLIAPRSLSAGLDRLFAKTRYEDFKVQVLGAPEGVAARLAALDNVAAVQPTVERDVTALVGPSEMTVRVISLPDSGTPSVNSPMVESGAEPAAGATGALAERHLTKQYDLKPGDGMKLVVSGREVPVTVTGSAASPRFLRLVADQSSVLSDPTSFGVLYMRQPDMERIFGPTAPSMFALRVKDKAKLDDTMAATSAVLSPYGIVGSNTGAAEQSTRMIMMDVNNMKNISLFFAFIFLYVTAMAIYIVLARIIYTEQRQIGTARALGYERSAIAKHFTAYGAAIGLTGGVLGAVAGIFLGALVVRLYGSMIGLPAIEGSTRIIDLVFAGIGIALVLSVLGALIPARHSARIPPAAAMRMDAGVSIPEPTAASVKRAERTKVTPSWLRFPARNLSRNRRRTVLSGLALVVTLATLISITGALASIQYILVRQSKIQGWDVAAYLPATQAPAFLGDVRRIDGVERAEPAIESPARITTADGSADVDFQAYEAGTKMHEWFPDGSGSGGVPATGVVLNRSLKRELPLKVGQSVTIDSAAGQGRFNIAGFVREPIGVGCYADLASIQRMLGSDRFNIVMVKANPGATEKVASALRRMPAVGKVETRNGIFNTLDTTINKGIRPMFNILLAMILAIGCAIVFTLASITILERRQETATMLTLGTGKVAVGRSFLIEMSMVAVVSLPFGIALGWGLCWVLMNKVLSTNTTQLLPEMSLPAGPVAVICVAFVALLALAVIPATWQVSKMDLASAARERTT
jgi:putative ABC transport system permease protein